MGVEQCRVACEFSKTLLFSSQVRIAELYEVTRLEWKMWAQETSHGKGRGMQCGMLLSTFSALAAHKGQAEEHPAHAKPASFLNSPLN